MSEDNAVFNPDTEIVHLASIFNPEVNKAVANILPEMNWETEVGKILATQSFTELLTFSNETIRSMLTEIMIPSELSSFIDMVNRYQNLVSKPEIQAITTSIFKYYKVRKLENILSNSNGDPDLIVKSIKSIPDAISSGINPVKLGSLKPSEVMEEEIGSLDRLIPSSLRLIRDSLPHKAYLPGQVVMVCAAPGVGKSALMLQECTLAAIENKKILWLALGDLMKIDFITRFTSVLTSTDFFKVAVNPDKYWTDEVKEVANRFTLLTLPADTITGEEIISLANQDDYDIVVVDYDSNVKQDSENMYEAGGRLYGQLTKIARPVGKLARLVFVGAQPNKAYWDDEIIPKSGAGESARKQHVIDLMITMGSLANSNIQAGMIHMAKVRRGKEGGTCGWHMGPCGKIKEVEIKQLSLWRNHGK